jgi:NADH-quinone oxidoreductase subunit C
VAGAAGTAVDTVPEVLDPLRDLLVAELGDVLGDAVLDVRLEAGRDLWVRVSTEAWLPLARLLQGLGFQYFCFLSVIDWLPSPYGRSLDSEVDRVVEHAPARQSGPVEHGYTGGDTRFQVFARLYSTDRKLGLTVKADVPDETIAVESWSGVYAGANWHEREAHEMYGVEFVGHPALKNLYLPGGFEGHPLRKDFPLLSRLVKPWPGLVDVEGMPGAEDAAGDDRSPRPTIGAGTGHQARRRRRGSDLRSTTAGVHRRPGLRRAGQPRDRDRGDDPQHRAPAPGHPRDAAHRRQARR